MKTDKKILMPDEALLGKDHQHHLPEAEMFGAFSHILERDFPNPDRKGCPGSSVLRRIASGQMKLSEARDWLPHLGSCSACYQDFLRFQRQPKQRKTLRIIVGAIAAILCLVLFSTLRLRMAPTRTESTQMAVLDLRGRSELRGGQSQADQTSKPVLKLLRRESEVAVYLPLGSPRALYELEFLDSDKRQPRLLQSTTAQLQNHITILRVPINPSTLPAGAYLLGLRHDGSNWSYYPVVLE